MKTRMNRKGQSALFDGFLFFTIMVIASVLVLVSAATSFQEQRIASGKDLVRFAHEARDAYFSSTIPTTTYRDSSGTIIELRNYTVLDLILTELSLKDDGLTEECFDIEGGMNQAIVELGERLIGELRLHFAILGSYESSLVELFPQDVPDRDWIPFDRVTSTLTVSMTVVGKVDLATIDLYIWV